MRKKHPSLKKNDKVIVLAGKDIGKIGSVIMVDSEKGRATVEKINIAKRHSKPGPNNAQGGIIEKEASIHISNLQLVCGSCAEPTRIGKKVLEDGSRTRVCKKCGEALNV